MGRPLTLCCFVVLLAAFALTSTAFEEDPEILANIAESEALLAELNSLLGDSGVSNDIKQGLENSVEELVQEERGSSNSRGFKVLGFARISDGGLVLPEQSQCEMSCCKVIIPPATLSRANRRTYSCQQYYTERYSTGCGVFGWRRCRRSRTRSRYSACVRYETVYYSQDQSNRACPANQVTCCKGFIWYHNCCIAISKLRELIEEAKRLQAGKYRPVARTYELYSVSQQWVKLNIPRVVLAVGCEVGWVSSRSGSCYKFVKERKNWNDARTDCQSRGGDLAQITTLDKTSKMQTIRTEIGETNNYYWIGAKQDAVRQRAFSWTSGGAVNSALWFPGEPNQLSHNGLLCVDLGTTSQQMKMNDWQCSDALSYVCEK